MSREIREAAAAWFVEFVSGEELQAGTRENFIEWLRRSPEHVQAYLQTAAHYEEAAALGARAESVEELVALGRDAAGAEVIEIGESAQRGLLELDEESESELHGLPPRKLLPGRFLTAASVVVLMIGAGAAYWTAFERGVYRTAIGEQRSVRLDDGSTVELNARSTMRVRLKRDERSVELMRGQALFRVAKDSARPFVVRSGATKVLAVGTEFDVYRHQDGTTVTVVEGRVAVYTAAPDAVNPGPGLSAADAGGASEATASAGEQLLGAGEQLRVSGAATVKAEHADVAAATAWTQKQIVLNSMPLSAVVEEFNRYNARQMVIVDPNIVDTKISGEFSSTNPESLLKGLAALQVFKIRDTAANIEISAK
jgi:transmembrane sensor